MRGILSISLAEAGERQVAGSLYHLPPGAALDLGQEKTSHSECNQGARMKVA